MRWPAAIPLLAILALAGPVAGSAEDGAAGRHASYDVQVWNEASNEWQEPSASDGLPDHWEWWATPSATVDADGRRVATTAYRQAMWHPDGQWTNVSTTHVARGGIVREDATTFGPLPWTRSDVALNYGPGSLNFLLAGSYDTSQTLQTTRFGQGPLPCGSQATIDGDGGLLLVGSCGKDWPSGPSVARRLSFAAEETIDGIPATKYGGADASAWMADGLPVPVRIEVHGIRLTLVGLGSTAPALQPPAEPPTVPARTAWDLGQVQPWGLDEADASVAHPFTASQAYQAALAGGPVPLALFLAEHPDARPYAVKAVAWQTGARIAHRWDFLVADDRAVWNGSVLRESEGAWNAVSAYGVTDDLEGRSYRLPPLAGFPDRLPTVGSLMARWSAWTGGAGGANVWGYEVRCADRGCAASQTLVVAGRQLWEFPSQSPQVDPDAPSEIQGTANLATFNVDGSAHALEASDWRTARPSLLEEYGPGTPSASAKGPARLLGIDAGHAKALAITAVVASLAALAVRYLPVALGLYARIRTDALPDHPTRAAILDLVSSSPGIRYSDLLKVLGCGKGTLEHHLGKLEAGGHVVMVKRNGLATYFRTRQAAEGHAMAWLRSTTARRLLGLIAEGQQPTARLHLLAGCSRTAAHNHLVRIEAAGLVRRDGKHASITEAGLRAWSAVQDIPQAA